MRKEVTLRDLAGLGSSERDTAPQQAGMLLPVLVVLLAVAGACARVLDVGAVGLLVLMALAGAACTPVVLLIERRFLHS